MEMIQSDYELQELCADAVSYNNHPTAATMEELEKRNLFLHDYRDKGFVYACQRNFSLSRKEQVKNCLRRICFRERGWK